MADRSGIDVDFDLAATDHPVMTLTIGAPEGVITVMAEVEGGGRTLRLVGLHMHSDAGPNAFGAARLRELAIALMEMLDVDIVLVEGARRTTGANPGDRARSVRFTRQAAARRGG